MKRIALMLVLATAVIGCPLDNSSTDPTDVAGSYTLSTVNGNHLPADANTVPTMSMIESRAPTSWRCTWSTGIW